MLKRSSCMSHLRVLQFTQIYLFIYKVCLHIWKNIYSL